MASAMGPQLRRIIPKCIFHRNQSRVYPTTIEIHLETNSHDDVPLGFQYTGHRGCEFRQRHVFL